MINAGSIILLVLFGYIIRTTKNFTNIYKKIFIVTVVIELMIGRGYFIKISGQEIAYRTVCEVLLAFFSLVILFSKRGLNKKVFEQATFLLLCLLIGWMGLILFPTDAKGATMHISWDLVLTGQAPLQNIIYSSSMLTEMIQVLMYILVITASYNIFEIDEWKDIFFSSLKWTKHIVVFNLFELSTKDFFHSNIFDESVDAILGSSIATYNTLIQRGRMYLLNGLTKEPSHYAYNLSILFLMYIFSYLYYKKIKETKKKEEVLYMILVMVQMIASYSFSAIYFGVCILLFLASILFIRKRHELAVTVIIISMTIALVIIMVCALPLMSGIFRENTFWGRRMLSVIEEIEQISNGSWLTASTALEWSNRVRLGSTYETFKLIIYRPIFGLGFAAVSAHSSLAMLFAGCGLIGSFCYMRMMFFMKLKNESGRSKGIFLSGVFVFLLMTALNSLSLRPFYEIWTIVFIIGLKQIGRGYK